MKTPSGPDVIDQPECVKRGSLRRMVGCLRGITWAIRIVVMLEFAIRIMVSLTLGQYGNAAWEIAVVVAVCPAWDETASGGHELPRREQS